MAIYLVRLSHNVNNYIVKHNPDSIQLFDAVDVTLSTHLLNYNNILLYGLGFAKCNNYETQYWDCYLIRTDFIGYNPIYEVVMGRLKQKLRIESIDKIIN